MSAEMQAILWTAAAASAATRGQTRGAWQATGVSIDSRTVSPGDLFVALKGPSFNGHAFVTQALAAGAAAALVAEPSTDGTDDDPRRLMVGDTLTALEDLGRAARQRTAARVVAVTGSVGKTGTKEALLACLGAQAPSVATVGSLNNHWGVPLSLARLPVACQFGIFELGMNHAGEIGPLSQQVRPEVGLITTIAPAHMEFFGSLEAIADAKAELFEGMAEGAVAILNRDNPQFHRLQAAALDRGLRVRGFGSDRRADARLINGVTDADGSHVTVAIDDQVLTYRLALPGHHWVINSLGVLLAVEALGANVVAAAGMLGQISPVKGRGTRRSVRLAYSAIGAGDGVFTLIDESYNASPAAMEAAFQVLAQTAPTSASGSGSGGRRVAVLGDMRELGERADAYHAALAEPLSAANVDAVFCCGPHMRALFDALPVARQGGYAGESAALAPQVAASIRPGDVVLVKGSAGSRMSVVVTALSARDDGGADTAQDTTTKASMNHYQSAPRVAAAR